MRVRVGIWILAIFSLIALCNREYPARAAPGGNLAECANYVEKEIGHAALQHCQKAHAEDPKLADVYFWRGGAYVLLNRLDEAIRDYNKFISVVPDEALAYKNRAIAFRSRGDLQSALQDANRAIEINPKLYEAWVVRSMTNILLGRAGQAWSDINTAINLDPEKEPAYTVRGHLYDWLKYEHELAARDFETSLKLNPLSYQVRVFRAEHAHYFLRNRTMASDELRSAFFSRPHGEWTFIVTSEILRDQGQLEAALEAIDQALKYAPSSWLAYIHRSLVHYYRKDMNSALANVNQALAMAPDSVMALEVRSRYHIDQRRLEQAAADCLRVLELSEGQYWRIYENIGDLFLLRKDRGKAAMAYRDYVRLAPTGDPTLPAVKKKLQKLE